MEPNQQNLDVQIAILKELKEIKEVLKEKPSIEFKIDKNTLYATVKEPKDIEYR